jgi:DNA-nicking Smr family endonuclease
VARRDRTRHPAIADWELWTAVTRSVNPLRGRRREIAESPLPIPEPGSRPAEAARPLAPPLPAYRPEPRRVQTAPGEAIEPKMRRKLMRGRIEIDGTLDLHGMRQVEAHEALTRFLAARYARGDRTIIVITGKGLTKLDDDATRNVERGVLRAMLPVWLSEPALAPMVAGWSPAAQGHGGEGAFYVRLRRNLP